LTLSDGSRVILPLLKLDLMPLAPLDVSLAKHFAGSGTAAHVAGKIW
jgi:hypothetical protein